MSISVVRTLYWILEATTTTLIVWMTLFPKGGYYALKISIVKTLVRFKEEMVDFKEFVHLIYDNITHDVDAIKNHGEEFAHLMWLVNDLCSTVFGPRTWCRLNDQIEVCIDGCETRFPATYLGRHHINGHCLVQYHGRYTADVEVIPNYNILGKRKKIPHRPLVEGMLVEVFHEAAWKPAVTKVYPESHDCWIIKLGEKDMPVTTNILRSYQPIDDRRLCDGIKDSFRFLCSDGQSYSYSFHYANYSESDEEFEPDEEPPEIQ